MRISSGVSNELTYRPFHKALLSENVIAASAFERSFSTSFGQGPIEEISKQIALENGFVAERQKETLINIYKGAMDEITNIINSLRAGIRKPNWNEEIKTIAAYRKGDTIVRKILSDLWMVKDGRETFISIKTVKPNLDQTEIAKRDMLMLKANNPDCTTFFGLYYNPGGENQVDYNWSIPSKLFDMKNDSCVIIGKNYWDTIGGKGTYAELLRIFSELGAYTQERIKHLSI